MIDFTEYLNRHNTFAEVSNQQKLDESHAINTVLVKFGVHVTRVIESPRFLQYRVQLTPDCNVDKMLKLRENLCIALNDDSVNLYREKAELVIEKRGENNTIMLGDLYTDYFKSKDGLTIMLGKDLQGVNVYTNLAKAPHILIAGTTGSGKSIMLHATICSLLMKNPTIELYTVDTKQTEFNTYGHLPNVHTVTDANEAVQMFRNLCNKMESRYTTLTNNGCRDIDAYNQKIGGMNRIVVVVDELADLMLLSGKVVEEYIVRLAQKARACGIHLIIATQRPTANVVTGLIKANIPTRVCLKVTSGLDSRIILDRKGGEVLTGHGDMLFLSNGAFEPVRISGCYVSEREIRNIVALIKKHCRTAPQEKRGFMNGIFHRS